MKLKMTRRARRPLFPASLGILVACCTLVAAPSAHAQMPDTPTDPAPVNAPSICHAETATSANAPVTILRVALPSRSHLAPLLAQHDVWSVHLAEGYAVIGGSLATMWQLQAEGYTVEVDAERTEQLLESLRPTGDHAAAAEGDPSGIPLYPCYRTVSGIQETLFTLESAYPMLASVVDIGDSWDKVTPGGPEGNDLYALVLTNKRSTAPKFPFVLMASIHARELATGESALRFAETLLAAYGSDAQATWLLDHGILHVLPMVNPDGRKLMEEELRKRELNPSYGPMALWRKNANSSSRVVWPWYGIDLNRNSSYMWRGCVSLSNCASSDAPSSDTYRGLFPKSEPETQAIESYISTVFVDQRGPGLNDAAPIDTQGIYLNLHSYGQYVLYPWGYTSEASPNEADLASVSARFGAITRYRSCRPVECLNYAADGTTDDWVYGIFGVPAFTVEMGQNFLEACNRFESPATDTDAILPRMLQLFRYAFSIAREPYAMARGPLVETLNVTTLTDEVNAPSPLKVHIGEPVTITADLMMQLAVSGQQDAAINASIAGAQWYLDQPPWLATVGGDLLPLDGSFDSSQEVATATLDTTSWILGRHMIIVQASSTDGFGGAPLALFVDVVDVDDPDNPRMEDAIRLPIIKSDAP